MKFAMKFVNEHDNHIGIVFRAKDLDNYFMLEMIRKTNGNLCVKPHVRYQGAWERMIQKSIGEGTIDLNIPANIVFEVYEIVATLNVNDRANFEWVLPTHVDINHVESGSRSGNNKETTQSREIVIGKVDELGDVVQKVPFRNKYGMIGFRAHFYQGAIICGLKITSL